MLKYSISFFIFLNSLDFLLTKILLNKGYVEVSPFFKPTFEYFILTSAIIVCFFTLAHFIAERNPSRVNRFLEKTIYATVLLLKALAVIHNSVLLFFNYETPLAKIYIWLLENILTVKL